VQAQDQIYFAPAQTRPAGDLGGVEDALRQQGKDRLMARVCFRRGARSGCWDNRHGRGRHSDWSRRPGGQQISATLRRKFSETRRFGHRHASLQRVQPLCQIGDDGFQRRAQLFQIGHFGHSYWRGRHGACG